MKNLILAFVFFCITSLAFANPIDYSREIIVHRNLDVKFDFAITENYEEILREVKSIAQSNMRVKSCTVTVEMRIYEVPMKFEFTAETCEVAAKAAGKFIEAVISND